MQNEQKRRLEKFKKVSGYLLWFTMPSLIIFGIGGSIAWIIFLFKPLGPTSFVEIASKVNEADFLDYIFTVQVTLETKFALASYSAVLLGSLIYILFHFHSIIECFYDGRIFDTKTLGHARKAYKVNLWIIYFEIVCHLFLVLSIGLLHGDGLGKQLIFLAGSCITNLIILGFLSLLLWALEMGTDLNEEATLTI